MIHLSVSNVQHICSAYLWHQAPLKKNLSFNYNPLIVRGFAGGEVLLRTAMALEVGQMTCTVSLEQLSATGTTLKKSVHRNITLFLGRNEFKEIILKFDIAKKVNKFVIRNIVVFKKFAKEGKATLKFSDEKILLMLSNCPPDQLIMFLKTMCTKLECLKDKGFVSERQKLLSAKPRVFQEISPLNVQELQAVHNRRAKQEEAKVGLFTPKLKRKREEENEKENLQSKGTKMHRESRIRTNLTLGSNKLGHVLNPVKLNVEQNRVLKAVTEGHSLFFTGSAGTGKSFLLRRIIGALAPQLTFATASTGVAACHIGGTTLHAFAGIGSGTAPIEQCIELASRPAIASQWRKCKHLIIDEVSMVGGEFFDKLETVARVIRKSEAPFGGIQLILCGDFLQLPPVTKGSEKRKFAFQSRAWRQCINANFELKEVRRQSDQKFINILQNIRMGRCSTEVLETLTSTAKHAIEKNGIQATRLCTHKQDVDQINQIHLQKLQGDSRVFQATDSDPYLVKTMDAMCPVKEKITLKEGTQVMLTKNLDVQKGLVNGARGVVMGFEAGVEGFPVVRFMSGVKVTLRNERWTFKAAGGVYLSRKQLPLKLAWAISIHKSQGMTLDCVEISLARVFESGQSYVALSRAKSLEGLRVLDFSSGCIRADAEVLKFYQQLRLASGLQQSVLTKFKLGPNSSREPSY